MDFISVMADFYSYLLMHLDTMKFHGLWNEVR
jgi:hypothetical protein